MHATQLNNVPHRDNQKPVPNSTPRNKDANKTRIRFTSNMTFSSNKYRAIKPTIFAKPSLKPGIGTGMGYHRFNHVK